MLVHIYFLLCRKSFDYSVRAEKQGASVLLAIHSKMKKSPRLHGPEYDSLLENYNE
jgi:hypothetical protein